MKRTIFLATAALVAMMLLAPTAGMAQDEDTMMPEQNVIEVGSVEEATQMMAQGLPKSGGPEVGSVLLPAAALLVGSGVLAYAVLRRR